MKMVKMKIDLTEPQIDLIRELIQDYAIAGRSKRRMANRIYLKLPSKAHKFHKDIEELLKKTDEYLNNRNTNEQSYILNGNEMDWLM